MVNWNFIKNLTLVSSVVSGAGFLLTIIFGEKITALFWMQIVFLGIHILSIIIEENKNEEKEVSVP